MKNNNLSLGDRFAEISVFIITAIALLIGWNLKSNVENRAYLFEANGISVQAPDGWRQIQTSGDEAFHSAELSSDGFGTTYIVRNIPIPADASAGGIASLLTLERGQKMTAFRVLDQREVNVNDKIAYELSYVFVESNPDLTHASAPKVVYGVDYIYINGNQAVVVTYWAEEGKYEIDLDRFHRFLQSVKF